MTKSVFLTGVLLMLASWGCGTVNRCIVVEDGKTVDRSLYSVNGSIRVGHNCTVKGAIQTVNGAITIEPDSIVHGTVASVNGSVRLAQNVTLENDLKSINGSIHANHGCTIEGGIASVNGTIQLVETFVGKELSTYTGRITISDHSTVKGNIRIRKSDSVYRGSRLTIVIERESVVHGDIINENPQIQVLVQLKENARVDGKLKNVSLEQP